MSRALWRRVRRQLEADGTWTPVAAESVDRFVRVSERARHARARITEPGQWTALVSHRQLVQHPDVKTAREAERDAHEYASALLLTPAARKRAGLEEPIDDGEFGGVL